ncbi:hypothetical protein SBY92_002003 [Candida maltosa Xu316]
MVDPEQFVDPKADTTQRHHLQQQQQQQQRHHQHNNHHHQQQLQHQQQQQQLKIQEIALQQHLNDQASYIQHYANDTNQHLHHQQQQPHQPQQQQQQTFSGLTSFDLKSKDSKYKRWTPRMDQYLITLLSDVVHSYPRGAEPEMNKKAWLYVCKQLRNTNPETVYSTYSKYSVHQHLSNVIQHRYKIWYSLMVHGKKITSGYGYRWSAELGRFQIIDIDNNRLIVDSRQIKSILYSDSLDLPDLTQFNKSTLISNDFFLSDNLRYMSVYHNEILPVLAKLDTKFTEDIGIDGDVYIEIPKFNYPEANNEFFKPLVQVKKTNKRKRKDMVQKQHDQETEDDGEPGRGQEGEDEDDDDEEDIVGNFNNDVMTEHLDDSVDPDLKRAKLDFQNQRGQSQRLAVNQSTVSPPSLAQQQQQQQQQQPPPPPPSQVPPPQTQLNLDIENALASATIAAMNVPIKRTKNDTPYYIKDAKWFNKLIYLHDMGHIRADEVLCVCEGVRDNKIPLFMLNVLDQDYYPTRANSSTLPIREVPDEETTKRIREFMLPMVYNS